MFNLTCYSTDGINYTIEQLENYYTSGQIRDITKYIKSDSVNLNRVKTYKKINFQYEKSESLVNVGFISANGIEYGSLFYDTQNEGEEYNIKLPFEDLNFNNLSELLQVGYALKSDLQKYIPKSIILYDYNPTALTTLTTDSDFYFNTNITGGTSTLHTTYKAFGQEYFDGTDTYSLNFNAQQSTLTNEVITNSLYQQYYENYLANIFDSKARLVKVSGILPTSLLTTLKLNDRLIIRDKRYLINTFTTDLTTGEVQFELLTDFRELTNPSLLLNLDAGNTESYSGTGTLWTDLSQYSNNGTLVNSPTFDSANGGSIVFDGSNDYVSVLNNSVFNNLYNFSISTWVNYNSRTGLNETIISKSDFGFNLRSFHLLTLATNNSINLGISEDGANVIINYNFPFTPVIGNWYNITATFNSLNTSLNRVNIYINSVELTVSSASQDTSGYNFSNTLPILIGAGKTSGNYVHFFNGKISNVNFYNRELTSTEVLQNYNATKARYGL
jgi:hypothetical protein